MIVNPGSAPSLAAEISKKKELLERLYGDTVECVVVCAKPLKELKFLAEGDATVVIGDGEHCYQQVHENEILHKKSSPAVCEKRMDGAVW